ncbi:histidine utilization repressor [Comamonas flocculans]|uniref:Histidine utilization repressor n=1 Tax=Comamonas flocculans TaxID=2597701 RepID=A0A5B8RT84_9BURK|nr:histidine utilization repressor [Comamonas flocculans]QEA12756.1 histidine utilization repressor [Comamonas flocculans]
MNFPTTSPDAAPRPKRAPAFQVIKEHVLRQIHEGRWREGDAIPGEEALAREFGVSRMTVNRALRELSSEQVLERVQGSGTFVAQQKFLATLVELRNIADEIAARGHRHSSELQLLERTRASDALAHRLGLAARAPVFHSVIVHFENGLPLQVEDRWVNPRVAPDYLAQDFTRGTPNAYLMKVAPLQGVDFEIEADTPTEAVRQLLRMQAREFCLVLRRTTYSMGQVASVAAMWHPAKRYRFTGHI